MLVPFKSRLAAIAVFAATFTAAFTLPAFAATVYSNWTWYGPVDGRSYENRSATSDNSVMSAVIWVRGKNGTSDLAGGPECKAPFTATVVPA